MFPQNLTISSIKEETSECKTFFLEPAEGDIIYKAGQYITFNNDQQNVSLSRSYSISTAPFEQKLAITVKRQENGYFSRMMMDRMKVGDQVRAIGVFGKFTLRDTGSDVDTYLFFAAGSGIVPVYSLIKEILNKDTRQKIILYYSSRSKKETIFFEALNLLHLKYFERFRIEYFFSKENEIHTARISAFMIPEILNQTRVDATHCYLCGPVDYMDTISMSLLTYGFPRDFIFKEEFYIYNEEIENEIIPPPDTNRYQVDIQLNNEVISIPVQYPESILNAALRQNIHLPYSCSSGQCGSCAAILKKGKIWMTYNTILTDQDIERGMVLTCMGFPIEGDVTIGYE